MRQLFVTNIDFSIVFFREREFVKVEVWVSDNDFAVMGTFKGFFALKNYWKKSEGWSSILTFSGYSSFYCVRDY